MALQMLVAALVVALSAAALIANGAIAYRPTMATSADTEIAPPRMRKLRIISVTQERLEVEFYTPAGGIHILSEVRSGGDTVRISITSTNGEPIFAADRPLGPSSGLLSIVGNEFLVVNETLDSGETKLTEYVVPAAYSLRVKNAMKRHLLGEKILRHLDRETVNVTGSSALEELMTRPEVEFIVEAAHALGNAGLYGVDNPAVMVFYTTAMRFAKAIGNDIDEDADVVGSGQVPPEVVSLGKRAKRGFWDWVRPTEYCSNSRSTCRRGWCPEGGHCQGLCGPGCNCWRWVCGDCCWNRGCYWHDRHLCGPGGTSSVRCWLTAPAALVCSLFN